MIQIPMYTLAEERTFVVADCETTGLDPKSERLVEVAAVRFEDGQPTDIFETLVNPGVPIPPTASSIHFIDDDDVVGAPTAETALDELAAFVGDSVVVAHNAAFDRSFLKSISDRDWLCSLRLARHLWPDAPSHKNAVLRFWLDIRHPMLKGVTAHRAAGDALTTGLIFERGIQHLLTARPDASMYDLAELIASPIHVERFPFGRKHAGDKISEIPSGYLTWVLKDSREPDNSRRLNLDADTLAAVQEELEMRKAA